MIVYEKNNKLNINFENSLENPDIEFGKGEINVDGNNIVNGGSGGSPLFVVTITDEDKILVADKTFSEIYNAFISGSNVVAYHEGGDIYFPLSTIHSPDSGISGNASFVGYHVGSGKYGGVCYNGTYWILVE